MSSNDSQGRPKRTNVKCGAKWCILPDSLLRMIRDKVDFFDGLCMAAVCRDWRTAFDGYANKQTVGDGIPWIMQWHFCDALSALHFTSVERNKKFTVELPKVCSPVLLFSKQGWLLLWNHLISDEIDWMVLVNPLTKATIRTPHLVKPKDGGCLTGCFSTHGGYPHNIVLLQHESDNMLTILTSRPCDEVWTKQSYVAQAIRYDMRGTTLQIVEQNIYIADMQGNMVIYNMCSQLWKELPNESSAISHILEFEGHVIKLDLNGISPCYISLLWHFSRCGEKKHCPPFYKICRYNETDSSWASTRNDDMQGVNLFLDQNHGCFAVRTRGSSKAYVLSSNSDETISCYIRDLVDGSWEKKCLSYLPQTWSVWVDIG